MVEEAGASQVERFLSPLPDESAPCGPDLEYDAAFLALNQAAAGKPVTYASVGPGSFYHLLGEHLSKVTGIPMTHVPYKGAAPAITALLGGEVQVLAADLPAVKGFTTRGVKILAVSGAQRWDSIPNVPSTTELGLPGVIVETNYGLIASKGTPTAITQKMREAIIATLATPSVKAQFAQMGADTVSSTPDEYRRIMQQESARWGALVKRAGITLD